MAEVDVTVYFLEMFAPPSRSVPAPRSGLSVRHVEKPSVAYYRALYSAVGRDFHSRGRPIQTDADFAAILDNPRDELHVLHVDETPAGFAELDRREPGEIELTQFGLTADFIGQGL